MSAAPPPSRAVRAERTRILLLDVAERLYAERGLAQVSNRQVAEAAGQANNSAVAYHVGTKADLVAAISARIGDPVVAMTARLATEVAASGSASPRDHVATLVRPFTDHLGTVGHPSWSARFVAQVVTDPVHGLGMAWWEELAGVHRQALSVVWADAPPMATELLELRMHMMRTVVVHTCAELEGSAATTDDPVDWPTVGEAMIDAVTGMLLAPIAGS